MKNCKIVHLLASPSSLLWSKKYLIMKNCEIVYITQYVWHRYIHTYIAKNGSRFFRTKIGPGACAQCPYTCRAKLSNSTHKSLYSSLINYFLVWNYIPIVWQEDADFEETHFKRDLTKCRYQPSMYAISFVVECQWQGRLCKQEVTGETSSNQL